MDFICSVSLCFLQLETVCRDYNDYLEMVEDIIYNLSNNIEILETNKKIAEYKTANKDTIAKNRARVSNEELELQGLLMEEAKIDEARLKV